MQNTVPAPCGPADPDDAGAQLLATVATLITEGRIAAAHDPAKFFEGPHCALLPKGAARLHECDPADSLCLKYAKDRATVLNLCRKEVALCIDVLLTCQCEEIDDRSDGIDDIYVLEQWHLHIDKKKSSEPPILNATQLASAIRSQLYFSQITAWLRRREGAPATPTPPTAAFRHRLRAAGAAPARFPAAARRHEFPPTEAGGGRALRVACSSLPRTAAMPTVGCNRCAKARDAEKKAGLGDATCRRGPLLDDRMHTCCTVKGKHRCEEEDDHVRGGGGGGDANATKRLCQNPSMPDLLHVKNDLNKDKGQLLLDAIERSGRNSTKSSARTDDSDNKCDKRASDIFSIRKPDNRRCDSPRRPALRQKISFEDPRCAVPSPSQQAEFRKSLDSAASMVFHSGTGLPLTSSPAPVRRGRSRFDFDSSIDSVSAIKSALFSTSFSTDDDSESDGSVVSPCSPETVPTLSVGEARHPVKYRRKGHATGLLGSFEESVLNGRLEPVSTVQGFTAELGASGSFVPKHLVVPVTVFFYTLGDNDKVSSPYLSHINLGKKGYNVPKSGTVQVTLFNPLGTVVKMFVIMYDLSDMPANSQTFLRQRTLYMPADCKDSNLEWGPKWLRYLIHLRFISSKSGKIYLHSDVRMIIFRKSDMDTATGHGPDSSYELRSFTRMPANPRFSPRK